MWRTLEDLGLRDTFQLLTTQCASVDIAAAVRLPVSSKRYAALSSLLKVLSSILASVATSDTCCYHLPACSTAPVCMSRNLLIVCRFLHPQTRQQLHVCALIGVTTLVVQAPHGDSRSHLFETQRIKLLAGNCGVSSPGDSRCTVDNGNRLAKRYLVYSV